MMKIISSCANKIKTQIAWTKKGCIRWAPQNRLLKKVTMWQYYVINVTISQTSRYQVTIARRYLEWQILSKNIMKKQKVCTEVEGQREHLPPLTKRQEC